MESTNDTGSPLRAGRLVTCRLDELRPHSSYVRHRLTVLASSLSALAERGDLAFLEPLVITREHTVLDGYDQWELARLQGCATLPCVEFDLGESQALQWLIQKHRRSNGLNDSTAPTGSQHGGLVTVNLSTVSVNTYDVPTPISGNAVDVFCDSQSVITGAANIVNAKTIQCTNLLPGDSVPIP